MAEIWRILGNEGMASNYSGIAEGYVEQWEGLAMSGDGTHLTLSVSFSIFMVEGEGDDEC